MLSRPSSPSNFVYPLPSHTLPSSSPDHSLPMAKPHNSLEILLPSHSLYLRGTGLDVEPATLQGTLVLNLLEATAFKEITMQFRGKSRVPNILGEGSSVLGSTYHSNVIFTHDWSFLQGDRRHTPTLKAGRHVFPFQLQLEASLPSSFAIHGGLAGINYKLRATAVRPVFSSNLHAAATVRLIRSFASEALEYQQTLEVENTWPDKMMYSFMVPHKAWAAGDTVTTLVKFSPLLKGVRITAITSTVHEHLKTYTKSGSPHEESRSITVAKHEIRNGHAVTLQLTDSGKGSSVSSRSTPPSSTPNTPPTSDRMRSLPAESDPFSTTAQQLLNGMPISSGPSTEVGENSILGSTESERLGSTDETLDLGEQEVVTTLPLTIPVSSAPSHALEPIIVRHRIRWSILMSNPDGHVSELRCSLPLHILDHALLDDARIATRATRRLLFGLEDAQPHRLDEMELPSYPAHIFDRVANAYLPATIRVSNPWVNRSPTDESRSLQSRGPSFSAVGFTPGSPPTHITPHHTPPVTPGEISGTGAGAVALDWVNSELHRLGRAWQRPGSTIATPPDSTQTSRHPSRASSRAASPERGNTNSTGTGRSERERSHPHHSHHHGIFSLKPFTKVSSSLQSRHHSTESNPPPVPQHQLQNHASSSSTQPNPGSRCASPPLFRTTSEGERHGMELLSRALNEVPHYDVASRGFLGGGVTPLSSMRGLPSYEEAERSHVERDFATGFATRT